MERFKSRLERISNGNLLKRLADRKGTETRETFFMTKWLLRFIRTAQILMLLAAMAAFGYGLWHVGDVLLLQVFGEVVDGRVVGMEERTETRGDFDSTDDGSRYTVTLYYPSVRYEWPPGSGEGRLAVSPLGLEGDEIEGFQQGGRVKVRVLPQYPDHARPILPFAAYFWPGVAFTSGLLGLLLVGGLFHLHEGAFGRDISKGISLWRSVRFRHLLVAAIVVAAFAWGVRMVAPWAGVKELTALLTGEIRYLYPLLKARGEPPPGRSLNDAEAAMARLPYLGMAYASTALEAAIFHREKADIKRFLDAYEDPDVTFPVKSQRALDEAIQKRDLDTVTRLIILGFKIEDTTFDPLSAAIQANRLDLAQTLVNAGMPLDGSGEPNRYARLALARQAERTFFWLMNQGAVDATATDPKTGESLLDLALKRGMLRAASLLMAKGAPTRMPDYIKAVLNGDVEALRAALPESKWAWSRVGSIPFLHLAAQFGHSELARALLAAGAKPNAEANIPHHPRITPLHIAAQAGRVDVVVFLLSHPETKVDRRDGRQMTALAYALTEDHWPIVRALIEAGADPSQKVSINEGYTALHFAARKGDADAVRFLISKGGDPSIRSSSGVLPIEVAHAEVRELLVTP